MKAGKLPSCGNIDRDAHWGISGEGEWVFGYRLHSLVNADVKAPLPRDVRVYPAKVKDGKVFANELCGSLHQASQVVLGDGSYDERPCYDACDVKQVSLIAPLAVKDNTPIEAS